MDRVEDNTEPKLKSTFGIGGCTLQRHSTEKYPGKELCGSSPISVRDLYIPLIGLHILVQENRWSFRVEYIDRSQTHECGNWD